MIKKLILCATALLITVSADELNYNQDPFSNHGEKMRMPEKKGNFTNLTAEEAYNLPHIQMFLKDTGESPENLNKFIQIAIKDKNWQEANYFLNKSKTLRHLKTRNIDTNVMVPDYDKALESFFLSVRNNRNILSAYQGMSILEDQFMLMGRNAFTDKYMRPFSDVLARQNYCKGFLYYGRTYESKFGTLDLNRANKIFSDGEKICKAGKGYEFYLKNIKEERVKTDYLLSIMK